MVNIESLAWPAMLWLPGGAVPGAAEEQSGEHGAGEIWMICCMAMDDPYVYIYIYICLCVCANV